MRPWKLLETNYAYVKEHRFEVAVLPLGATEPHNLHLPYGTDVYEADVVGEKICEAAHARGAKVVLLPTIPYGTETNQMAFPLAMNLNPSTLAAVIRDLVFSLAHHGIKKIVLLNSHGGNDLKSVLRELHGQTAAQLFLCNWYRVLGGHRARAVQRAGRPCRRNGNLGDPGLSSAPGGPRCRRPAGRRRRRRRPKAVSTP